MARLDIRLAELETMAKRDLKDRWAKLAGHPLTRVSDIIWSGKEWRA